MRLGHLNTLLVVIAAIMQTQAYASEPAASANAPLAPAGRYSGRTPIDIKNGVSFNNGTYGAPNKDYEAWANDGLIVPGLSEKAYPYSAKAQFVSRLQESAKFVEDAITNWKMVTPDTKPEAKEYGEKSAQTMEPLLLQFKASIKAASGSSQSDWDKNQADAKHALSEMRGTYSSLHRNVK
jgi:hypothetical protein